MNLERVSSGEYEGAPSWESLERWAALAGVDLKIRWAPWATKDSRGIIYEATLHSPQGSATGSHHTMRGALYLLHHVVHEHPSEEPVASWRQHDAHVIARERDRRERAEDRMHAVAKIVRDAFTAFEDSGVARTTDGLTGNKKLDECALKLDWLVDELHGWGRGNGKD